jgi:hypothetical protein
MIKLTDVMDETVIQEHLNSGYRVVKCPVCGNEAFDNWAICPHCNWEHDELLHHGYSCANSSYMWWYKVKYFLRNIFK